MSCFIVIDTHHPALFCLHTYDERNMRLDLMWIEKSKKISQSFSIGFICRNQTDYSAFVDDASNSDMAAS